MKIKKRSLVSILCLLLSLATYAQSVEVIGKITDETGEGLPSVSILVKGTKIGVLSDLDGNYKINVPDKQSVLVFSFIGNKTQQIKVNNKSVINVKLESDNILLNEVVAVGYGSMRRKDLTGSVVSVNADDLSKVPVSNVAQALAGRVSGVNVQQSEGDPNAKISIRVRGGISLTQSNEPLYIIDGFPSEQGLTGLDPSDIESIDILKDASSTAIYGARGANGVVVINTKGGREGKTVISYDGYYGTKKISKNLDMLSMPEYVTLNYERVSRDAAAIATFTKNYGEFSQIEANYANRSGVNWQDESFRSANVQSHKVSISGGNKDIKYNIWYSHNNDEGIMIESGLKKDNIRLKLDNNINSKTKFSANLNYTNQKATGMGTSEGGSGFSKMTSILTYQPTVGLLATDEEFRTLPNNPWLDDDGNTLQNPATSAREEHNVKEQRFFTANASLQYEIFKGLTFKNTTGTLYRTMRNELFFGAQSLLAKRTSIQGSIRNSEMGNFQTANTLSYEKKVKGGHKFNVMLGQEYIQIWERYFETSVTNFPNDDIGLNDLSLGKAGPSKSFFNDDDKLLSFFGRGYYNFQDKYMITATLRADGSSKFGPNNKWGIFPSASIAWRASEEEFIQKLKIFSDLKVRVGYGTSGNNRINSYGSLPIWGSMSVPYLSGTVPGYYPSQIPNPNLKWEANKTFNVGLDMGFFNQRLVISPEFYINKSSDLLLDSKLPASSGHTSMTRNIGSTQNTGVDLSITSVNIKTRKFEWTTNFNISHNKNKILALAEEQSLLVSSNWGYNQSDYLVQVGKPLGQIYGFKTVGLYQVDDFEVIDFANPSKNKLKPGIAYDKSRIPQPGHWKYQDIGGLKDGENPLITEDDRQIIGDANPLFYGGINNTFTYKNFDFSFFLNYSIGNDILNATKLYSSLFGSLNKNTTNIANSSNRWMTIDNNGAIVKDLETLKAMNAGKTIAQWGDMEMGDQIIHSWAVEDGSFLRLSNVTLGYKVPVKWSKKVKISSLRVYATANNLFTITKYSGFDPEVSTRNSSGLTPGVDWGAYPRSRSFIMGVSLSF